MISIIVSSYQQHYLDAFRKNVAANIGVPYEIIVIENNNAMSLCRAYNLGAQQAQYDILCFSHEDLVFETANWGNLVENIFRENPKLGLLGVAGNTYKSLMPSHWSFFGARLDTFNMNIYHKCMNGDKPANHLLYNPGKTKLAQVAAIDGVWFCIPKKIANEIPFDESTFTSFHAYDVDISLAIGKKYQVAVTFEVDIHHYSEGKFSKVWIDETLKLHRKWQQDLPKNLARLSIQEQIYEEQKAFLNFGKTMLDNSYPLTEVIKLFRFSNSTIHFTVIEKVKLITELIVHKYKTRNIR